MADGPAGRIWVSGRGIAALDDTQRRKWDLLVRAYAEQTSLGRARNPFAPELAAYRRLFRGG